MLKIGMMVATLINLWRIFGDLILCYPCILPFQGTVTSPEQNFNLARFYM